MLDLVPMSNLKIACSWMVTLFGQGYYEYNELQNKMS